MAPEVLWSNIISQVVVERSIISNTMEFRYKTDGVINNI